MIECDVDLEPEIILAGNPVIARIELRASEDVVVNSKILNSFKLFKC